MLTNKTIRLYRVTFAHAVRFANGETYAMGETRDIKASSMLMAGTQSTTSDGADLANVELVAVQAPRAEFARLATPQGVKAFEVPTTGKDARKIARMAGVDTRHMLAFPAKVTARMVLTQSQARITSANDAVVTFHIGGAY